MGFGKIVIDVVGQAVNLLSGFEKPGPVCSMSPRGQGVVVSLERNSIPQLAVCEGTGLRGRSGLKFGP